MSDGQGEGKENVPELKVEEGKLNGWDPDAVFNGGENPQDAESEAFQKGKDVAEAILGPSPRPEAEVTTEGAVPADTSVDFNTGKAEVAQSWGDGHTTDDSLDAGSPRSPKPPTDKTKEGKGEDAEANIGEGQMDDEKNEDGDSEGIPGAGLTPVTEGAEGTSAATGIQPVVEPETPAQEAKAEMSPPVTLEEKAPIGEEGQGQERTEKEEQTPDAAPVEVIGKSAAAVQPEGANEGAGEQERKESEDTDEKEISNFLPSSLSALNLGDSILNPSLSIDSVAPVPAPQVTASPPRTGPPVAGRRGSMSKFLLPGGSNDRLDSGDQPRYLGASGEVSIADSLQGDGGALTEAGIGDGDNTITAGATSEPPATEPEPEPEPEPKPEPEPELEQKVHMQALVQDDAVRDSLESVRTEAANLMGEILVGGEGDDRGNLLDMANVDGGERADEELEEAAAMALQRHVRGHLGRREASKAMLQAEREKLKRRNKNNNVPDAPPPRSKGAAPARPKSGRPLPKTPTHTDDHDNDDQSMSSSPSSSSGRREHRSVNPIDSSPPVFKAMRRRPVNLEPTTPTMPNPNGHRGRSRLRPPTNREVLAAEAHQLQQQQQLQRV